MINEIVATANGLKTAIEIAKTLRDASKGLDEIQVRTFHAELLISLADAKEEQVELRTEIAALKAKQALEDEMDFEHPFYYRIRGEKKDGPFCPQCKDASKLAIRLIQKTPEDWKCHNCENTFSTAKPQYPQGPMSVSIRRS